MPDPQTNDMNTTTDTSSAPPPAPPGEGAPPEQIDADGAGELGDAGKAALDSERKARRDAERELVKAQRQLEEANRAKLGDTERAVAEAADKARNETRAEYDRRLVAAEARARAAGKLANPEIAARLLDLDKFMPDAGEDIDGDAIDAAIDELVKAEPYLNATPPAPAGDQGTPPPKTGTVPAGARGDTAPTFKRSQLKDPAFYTANKDAILKAASEGRITND